MRTVYSDEIHLIDYMDMVSKDYFLSHIPNEYVNIFSHFNHVDTQLREDGENKHWRVQGYFTDNDIHTILKSNYNFESMNKIKQDAIIGFSRDKLEIWSLSIPYVMMN